MLWLAAFAFLLYVYMRLSRGTTKSATCLLGKTAIVTGANSGIGYQTVLNFASRGCRVIMADVADMEESKNNVIKYTNNKNIVIKYLDLSSLKSVRNFASDILRSEERLDILINNAGVGVTKETRTADGLHPVMQINYFGHFLLTHLLIDLLKKCAPSRIVSTSSSFAFFANLSLQNFNFDDQTNSFFDRLRCYSNSKLAVLIASDVFAEKLKNTGVTSNSIHPGFIATPALFNAYPIINSIFFTFVSKLYFAIYSKSPWEGGQILVHTAVSKQLEQVTGKYFWDCKPFIKPSSAHNKEFCYNIWTATEKYVQLRAEEKL